MQLVKAADGVGAAAGMKRDEHVARFAVIVLRDAHPLSKFLEDAGPTDGGNFIAVVEVQRRWRDELYIHAADYFAQVRKPAQTSRRSGV